jgi:16S rRNA G966 N2-methylase RsmD
MSNPRFSSNKTTSRSLDLNVVYLACDDLVPDLRNARQHSDRQVKQIACSIESFGFNVPLLIDAKGQVVAGHGRLLAARRLGWSEVPTIRLDHLSEAQARAFAIADNRLTDNSTWDDALLAENLKVLSEMDLIFDIEATGFTMGEIDLRIEGLANGTGRDAADEVPDQVAGPAVTQPGDIWHLGRHRVLCGNALEGDSYVRVLDGRQAALVFTDPPYNVPIQGHVSGLGTVQHREFAMASGEMSQAAFTEFLTTVCKLLAFHSTAGSIHYLCMDWRHMGELLAAGHGAYSELKNLCVWAKDNAGMGSLYRSQHELVFVWKSGTASHRNNVQLGQFGRNRTNIWSYPGVGSFGRGGEEGNLLALHPAVKPVAMVADAILDCSARGDIVLDPFLGSGSTLVAVERVGRVCCGIELDPVYVDIAIRRWQRHTGDTAVHAMSGLTFDDAARGVE